MQEKLSRLHHLFKTADVDGLPIDAAALSPMISAQITEILFTFGLPPTAEHLEILIEFGRAEECSDALIDGTLIRLADEGIYYLTLSRLAL